MWITGVFNCDVIKHGLVVHHLIVLDSGFVTDFKCKFTELRKSIWDSYLLPGRTGGEWGVALFTQVTSLNQSAHLTRSCLSPPPHPQSSLNGTVMGWLVCALGRPLSPIWWLMSQSRLQGSVCGRDGRREEILSSVGAYSLISSIHQ